MWCKRWFKQDAPPAGKDRGQKTAATRENVWLPFFYLSCGSQQTLLVWGYVLTQKDKHRLLCM